MVLILYCTLVYYCHWCVSHQNKISREKTVWEVEILNSTSSHSIRMSSNKGIKFHFGFPPFRNTRNIFFAFSWIFWSASTAKGGKEFLLPAPKKKKKTEALEIEFFRLNQGAINWKKVHMQKLPTGSHLIVGMSRGFNEKNSIFDQLFLEFSIIWTIECDWHNTRFKLTVFADFIWMQLYLD